jgi:hypothetical protein
MVIRGNISDLEQLLGCTPVTGQSSVSQLLRGSDVELHPEEGEEIEEELHSRVQAGHRSAGRHQPQAPRSALCREYGSALSTAATGSWLNDYDKRSSWTASALNPPA